MFQITIPLVLRKKKMSDTPEMPDFQSECSEDEVKTEERKRTKRAVVDCPPRVNTGADGTRTEEF